MNGFDDDWTEMTSTAGADSGGAGAQPPTPAAVTMFLSDLRELGEGPVPEPSPELAAFLGGVVPLAPARERRRVRRRHVALGVAASILVAGTGGVAAAGRLPAPAQRLVSDVVDHLTPFTIPQGGGPASPSVAPSGRRGPAAPVVPAPASHFTEPSDRSEPTDRSEPSDASEPAGQSDATGRSEPTDGSEPSDGAVGGPAQPGPGASSSEDRGWSGGGATAGTGEGSDGYPSGAAPGTSAPQERDSGGTGAGRGDG